MRWGFRHDPEGSFWSKVDRSGGPDACWEWLAYVEPTGYGGLKVRGKKTTASRYSLEMALGRPLRAGMLACHKCRNPICVNPKHLYEGTPKQNVQDAIDDGTYHYVAPENSGHRWTSVTAPNRRGLNGSAELPEAAVREIYRRARAGESIRALGREYGISHGTVADIKSRRRWGHLHED